MTFIQCWGKKGDLITIGIPTNQGIKEQKNFFSTEFIPIESIS